MIGRLASARHADTGPKLFDAACLPQHHDGRGLDVRIRLGLRNVQQSRTFEAKAERRDHLQLYRGIAGRVDLHQLLGDAWTTETPQLPDGGDANGLGA